MPKAGRKNSVPLRVCSFYSSSKLPQARDLGDREREADGPGLGAGPRVLADRTHDLRLLLAGGDDVDHVLFLRQRDAEEFFADGCTGALCVQDGAASGPGGARRVHDQLRIALVQNDDDQFIFKIHVRFSSLQSLSARQIGQRPPAGHALERNGHHDPVAGNVDVQLQLGLPHEPADACGVGDCADDGLFAAVKVVQREMLAGGCAACQIRQHHRHVQFLADIQQRLRFFTFGHADHIIKLHYATSQSSITSSSAYCSMSVSPAVLRRLLTT